MGLTVVLWAEDEEAFDRLGSKLKPRTHIYRPTENPGVVGVLRVDESVPIVWLVQALSRFQALGGHIIGYVVGGDYHWFRSIELMVEEYADRDVEPASGYWNTTTPGC